MIIILGLSFSELIEIFLSAQSRICLELQDRASQLCVKWRTGTLELQPKLVPIPGFFARFAFLGPKFPASAAAASAASWPGYYVY